MADTYSSRALLTGRELRRIRQRALDASPVHQQRVASTSATLRSRFTSADPARTGMVTRDVSVAQFRFAAIQSSESELGTHTVRRRSPPSSVR